MRKCAIKQFPGPSSRCDHSPLKFVHVSDLNHKPLQLANWCKDELFIANVSQVLQSSSLNLRVLQMLILFRNRQETRIFLHLLFSVSNLNTFSIISQLKSHLLTVLKLSVAI